MYKSHEFWSPILSISIENYDVFLSYITNRIPSGLCSSIQKPRHEDCNQLLHRQPCRGRLPGDSVLSPTERRVGRHEHVVLWGGDVQDRLIFAGEHVKFIGRFGDWP